MQKRLYRTPDAADYLGLGESTLEKMRMTGDGPQYVKLGRIVSYEQKSLDAWIEQRTRTSTSEPAAG
jgi:predicted DNA-binding transcriptional regulator AlpA